ncbi:unnamed protein product [Rotaria socialis]|uniref:Uncharacterized protein n=1 Tax=Rotaria socialis TaxID=392032 RepID=A0A817S587_9BILA|nr:unnamed protein product [Rotaria socialis]CAF3551960.1 unnamed protein product [Rotaria socialis]CAF3587359.1 unnamed protein product [Rotaria socialis]CAF3614991.1 unnamed protein product [Rotaria socialis]CAF3733625.1 unnamed protein product [Rotaria socialis]
MAAIFNSLSNAITAQPVADSKLNPFNTEWKTEFFESCNPITDGIIYCLCGCICAGRLHGRAGEHFFSCCFPGATQALRTKIRMAYGIRGSLIEDCLASCCGPCSLLQMKKELDGHNVPDPYA